MPYTDTGLPFSGATSISRHCSYLGAEDARHRAPSQAERYLAWLRSRGDDGATDLEAAQALGLERSSINARRAGLGDKVWTRRDTRRSPAGIKNTVWLAR